MILREATEKDGKALQELQSRCPQGTNLVAKVVNIPDFFSRAGVYEKCKVFIAEDGGTIKGSGACAIRNVRIDGQPDRVGYLFQAFVDPQYRRCGIAGSLLEAREQFLIDV